MDRTIIAPWKAEEKELSEKLYKKLQGLALLFPPAETNLFRKCIAEDMFLKPNQEAFFQVMHFLFCILDAAEFKKRFYWPLTDKRAEANFRSSTVEYLKHLNEKHQLQWTNIKSYLVVMPGGMKFIIFMLDFVGFVIRELTRQREKPLSAEIEAAQKQNMDVKRMRQQNQFFKEYASAYISQVEGEIVKLRDKTLLVKAELNAIAQKMAQNVADLTDDVFHTAFEDQNRKLFEEIFSKRTSQIISLEKPLFDLKVAIEKFQAREPDAQYNKQAVRQVLRQIQELSSKKDDDSFLCPSNRDDIDINALIKAFNSIYNTVEESMAAANEEPSSSGFASTELVALKNELQQIETQLADFQKTLNVNLKKHHNENNLDFFTPIRADTDRKITENALMLKFVCTPPIKLEVNEGGRNVNKRLPLIDDVPSKPLTESFSNFLAIRSARKPKHFERSCDLNFTNPITRSKILDPMQLLRTINTDTSKVKPIPQNNLSNLGSKWKERQYLLGEEINSLVPASPKQSPQSPFTPLSSNECTRVTRSQLLDAQEVSTSTLYPRNLQKAVQLIQDASLNFQNLSTSPSGRLEPLVTSLDREGTPKIQVNDITLNHAATSDVTSCRYSTSKHTPLLADSDTVEHDENNPNLVNTQLKCLFDVSAHGEEDTIFNISDSVLQDLIV